MFLVDADTPGMRIVRHIDTLDEGFFGGHCELGFDDVFVAEERCSARSTRASTTRRSGSAPARLTHCMRWLGHRPPRPGDRGRPGGASASCSAPGSAISAWSRRWSPTPRSTSRRPALLIWQACAGARPGPQRRAVELDREDVRRRGGGPGRRPVGADLRCARHLGRHAAARATYREVRPFRIYDGSSETHRWAIAKPCAAPGRTETDSSPVLTLALSERRLKWIQFSSNSSERTRPCLSPTTSCSRRTARSPACG